MEVGVFSKCIKELILDHDEVGVPGLGVFSAQLMPASFSDHRTTINPPYRELTFRKCEVTPEEGSMLNDFICSEMHVSPEQADVELKWCLSRIRSELEGNRTCTLPGLGAMRSTSQSDYFFVSDDNLDIFPDGFGLEPVSIRAIDEKPARRKPTRAEKRSTRRLSRAERRAAKAARTTPPRVTAEDKPAKRRRLPVLVRILLWLLAIAAIAVGAILLVFPDGFAGFGEFFSGVMDHLLYTKEELQLLGR